MTQCKAIAIIIMDRKLDLQNGDTQRHHLGGLHILIVMETIMTNSKPKRYKESEKSQFFTQNLLLSYASYGLALDICRIEEDVITLENLKKINPESMMTLRSILLILENRKISC